MSHRPTRTSQRLIARLATACALVAAGSTVAGATPAVAGRAGLRLDRPTAIAAGAGHLWLVERAGNAVTELTDHGGFVRTIHGSRYGFHAPVAIAVAGEHVFVLNSRGSVTELNARDGSLVRVIRGARYEFGQPTALVVAGGDVWVVDTGSAAVTEFTVGAGSLVRVLDPLHNHRFGLFDPLAITAAGADIWVLSATRGSAGPNAGSLTEIVAATGALKRIVHGPILGLAGSRGISFDGRHLWVTDSATDSVTELTSTGRLSQVVTNSSNNADYGFNAPTAITSRGGEVYVISPPGASPMVTQVQSSTARGMWYECNTNRPDPSFANPTGLAVDGGHVWVVSPANNSLAELSVHGGALIKRFT